MTKRSFSLDTREWSFCPVHEKAMLPQGYCVDCGGDRHLIQVVPRSTRDALQERLKLAEVCISANRLNARLYGDGGAIETYDAFIKKGSPP